MACPVRSVNHDQALEVFLVDRNTRDPFQVKRQLTYVSQPDYGICLTAEYLNTVSIVSIVKPFPLCFSWQSGQGGFEGLLPTEGSYKPQRLWLSNSCVDITFMIMGTTSMGKNNNEFQSSVWSRHVPPLSLLCSLCAPDHTITLSKFNVCMS